MKENEEKIKSSNMECPRCERKLVWIKNTKNKKDFLYCEICNQYW